MLFHQPVLVAEVLRLANLSVDNGIFCDCTAGGGGHLLAMLTQTKNTKFLGIDWDPEAIAFAKKMIEPYRERCMLFQDNFVNLGLILDRQCIESVNGVLFDLGLSLHQVATASRGFSFEKDAMLSMQMSPEVPSLLSRLRETDEDTIVAVLKEYGDVPNARQIGRQIFERRNFLSTTMDLRKTVEEKTPQRFSKKNLHRVFQALRIWTNDELTNLQKGILIALARLKLGGRILVISYHSGEDRIVKNILREAWQHKKLRLINKKVIRPKEEEIMNNPRARSAKLRVAEKCAAC